MIRHTFLRAAKFAAETAAAMVMLGFVVLATWGQGSPADTTFTKSIQPFFAKTCFAWHSSKLSSGGLNFEAYSSAVLFFQDRDEVEKILKKLQAGEMPMRALPRPHADELLDRMGVRTEKLGDSTGEIEHLAEI